MYAATMLPVFARLPVSFRCAPPVSQIAPAPGIRARR
jgi:hypothetical protein